MQNSSQIEIDSSDIDEITESTDIEEEYIIDSIERQNADLLFEESKRQKEESSSNTAEDIKKLSKFLARCVYMRPTTPNFATVTDVRSPENANFIRIKTETKYPECDGYRYKKEDEKSTRTFKLYNNNKDTTVLENLLDYTNASKPTDLIGKKIPITPDNTERRFGKSKFDYKIDVKKPDMTISQRFHRVFRRVAMRTNCLERESEDKGTRDSYGDFVFNKNIFAYIGILSFIPATFSQSTLFNSLFISFSVCYLILICFNILFAVLQIIFKNKGCRTYINQKLNK